MTTQKPVDRHFYLKKPCTDYSKNAGMASGKAWTCYTQKTWTGYWKNPDYVQ